MCDKSGMTDYIQVTAGMVDAGIRILQTPHPLSPNNLSAEIYRAMERIRRQEEAAGIEQLEAAIMTTEPQMTNQLLAERASAVLANCKDCGCEECVRIRNELIADFLEHIRHGR